jgi:cytochrome c553
MKSILVLLLGLILFTGCKKEAEPNKENETAASADSTASGREELKMYEMSEMAALMEQMYAENMMLKQRIVSGDTLGNFPQHFLKIHASAMTDESENDAFFKEQAANFIKAQELIYKDSVNAEKHFNDAVSACVKCHEQKCGGPIPRIKKLYIK